MEALKDVIPDETRVLRAKTIAIATDELVPGDVVCSKPETESPLMFVYRNPSIKSR
jgi:magnesium-transporting ATPase (P-type)